MKKTTVRIPSPKTVRGWFSRVRPYPVHIWELWIYRSMSQEAQDAFKDRSQKYVLSLMRSKASGMKIRHFYSQNLQVYSLADKIIDVNESIGYVTVEAGSLKIIDPTFGGRVSPLPEGRYLKDRRLAYRNLETDVFELYTAVVEIIRARAEHSPDAEELLSSDEYYLADDPIVFLEKKLARLRGKTLL